MRINLACPYEDRHSAKALGARWDIARKVWFIVNPPDLQPFARWLPADVRAFWLKAKAQPKRRTPSRGKAATKSAKNEGMQPGAPVGNPPW